MAYYRRILANLAADRRAVTTLEYALIAGLTLTAIIAGFGVFASDVSGQYGSIGSSVQAGPASPVSTPATPPPPPPPTTLHSD